MKKKLKVAVIMGGNSPEHDISVISGSEVVKNLDKSKYEILPVKISRDGKVWETGNSGPSPVNDPRKILQGSDMAFIAIHGAGGEDGKMQSFLELINVPYTGSGVLASALAMDKKYSKKMFAQAGLTVPGGVVVDRNFKVEEIWKKLKTPVFVKPSTAGSSVGVSKVKDKKSLTTAIVKALKYSDEVLVDEFIQGTEITCAILGNKKPIALPVIEIVTKNEFFDYEAKYSEELTQEIVPARISPQLTKKVQEVAISAYEALGCQGFGRVDMIIKSDKIYVLEVNTIPGLTPVSLLPKAAKAAGIEYSDLLDKVIDLSQE
jgi:D-alanine-D-alanine ligase